MGATDTRLTEAETGGTTATGSGNSSTSAAKNRGGSRGRGGTAATVNNEQVSKLVDVKNKPKAVTIDVPNKDTEEKPKPQPRGRPKGSTNKPTPRKTTPAKTKIDATQISVLLQTMTAIIAARPNMAAFAMTKDEADQLAKPLANIIGKSDAIAEAAGEYADHITLLVAAITIFVPKFLMYKMQRDAAIAQIPKIQEVANDTTTANNKAGQVSGSASKPTGQNRNTNSIQTNASTNIGSTLSLVGPVI